MIYLIELHNTYLIKSLSFYFFVGFFFTAFVLINWASFAKLTNKIVVLDIFKFRASVAALSGKPESPAASNVTQS